MGFNKTAHTKLLGKLFSVMQSVERIAKDAHNDHNNYDYSSDNIIKTVLRKEFVANKLLFSLESENVRIIETASTKITVVDLVYRFTCVESGQFEDGKFTGTGNGRDDKGHYAAITGAIKYILTSKFLIPTGDDPENNGFEHNPKPVEIPVTPPKQPEKPQDKPESTQEPPKGETPAEPPPPPPDANIDAEKAKRKEEKEALKKYPWGVPQGSRISTKDVTKVVAAFRAYDVSTEELKTLSGLPVEEWTLNIKKVALANWTQLKKGPMTKAELMS